MQTLEQRQAEIEAIIEAFDFEKVQKVMRLLNWKYFDTPVEETAPSIERLEKLARYHLEAIIKENIISSASGGFRASNVKNEEGRRLVLEFIVESTGG